MDRCDLESDRRLFHRLAWLHQLLAPLKRKKPTTYFVNSMGDLFHEDCPDEWIDKVFAVMALCPQHTFQVLTKRAARMRDYCKPCRHLRA
jgi:protein gp37